MVDAHRGVRWGRVNIVPPQANFKKLVNKNAIKPEIRGTPQAIFPESLDPPRDFGNKHQVPPPLDFQHVCIYVLTCQDFFDISRCRFLSCPDEESRSRPCQDILRHSPALTFAKITLGQFFSDSFEKVPIESRLAGLIEAGGMFNNSYFNNSLDFVRQFKNELG